jgi:hypothetical protein
MTIAAIVASRVTLIVVVVLLALTVQSAVCATCNTGRRCDVRILALGDSLTRGAVPSAQTTHPYAIQLRRSLQAQLARPASVRVDIRGTLIIIC